MRPIRQGIHTIIQRPRGHFMQQRFPKMGAITINQDHTSKLGTPQARGKLQATRTTTDDNYVLHDVSLVNLRKFIGQVWTQSMNASCHATKNPGDNVRGLFKVEMEAKAI
jgi:hypothetical protein